MFFFTYVLRSEADRKLYVGWTNDLKHRLDQHNKGFVDATKSRIPFKLIYFEACLNEEKAIKREKYFKSGFGRSFLRSRV